MAEFVIDASALLALLNVEPGAEVVGQALPDGVISAVNLAEVVGKLREAEIPGDDIKQIIQALGLKVLPFDEEQSYESGMLRTSTKDAGISLGDRACLSLAKKLGAKALTADKAWRNIKTDIAIVVIR